MTIVPLNNNLSIRLVREATHLLRKDSGERGGNGRQKGGDTSAELIHRFYAAANGGEDNSFVPGFRIRWVWLLIGQFEWTFSSDQREGRKFVSLFAAAAASRREDGRAVGGNYLEEVPWYRNLWGRRNAARLSLGFLRERLCRLVVSSLSLSSTTAAVDEGAGKGVFAEKLRPSHESL